MSDFTRDYKPGDILYGRFDQTQAYWAALIEERKDIFELFMKEETARSNCPKELSSFKGTTFKELSQKMQDHAKAGQTHAVISYFHKGFKLEVSPEDNLKGAATPSDQVPPRFNAQKADYHNALYKSHYSPFASVQINNDTGAAGVGTVGTYEKYLRRASKFGATQVGNTLGARVHFVLDEIDMKDVLDKAEFPEKPGAVRKMVPITTSELRALFRNWGFACKHVTFYRKQTVHPPPWDEDPKGWTEYAKRRCEKYAQLLNKQGKKAKIVEFDKLQSAVDLNRAGDEMRRNVTGEQPWY